MPIEVYQGTTIETTWEPGQGWWYRPFDSEEEAITEAEDRIDLEEYWE